MTPPFILTLGLHPDDQARLDTMRERHFPAHLNHIPAHATLFHHLPGADPGVPAAVALLATRQAPFDVTVEGLRSLGRGVAYSLASEPLLRLRAGLARHWHEQLTAQDRQGWRPHVTIQNKVAPAEAKELLALLQAGFSPFTLRATGLCLWRYLGGPWEAVATCAFAGSSETA